MFFPCFNALSEVTSRIRARPLKRLFGRFAIVPGRSVRMCAWFHPRVTIPPHQIERMPLRSLTYCRNPKYQLPIREMLIYAGSHAPEV